VLIGVTNREKIYILWAAVGWKLGAGRMDKCPRVCYITTGVFMYWVGVKVFEIAALVRLGILRELACLLGGGSGCRIVHRK